METTGREFRSSAPITHIHKSPTKDPRFLNPAPPLRFKGRLRTFKPLVLLARCSEGLGFAWIGSVTEGETSPRLESLNLNRLDPAPA